LLDVLDFCCEGALLLIPEAPGVVQGLDPAEQPMQDDLEHDRVFRCFVFGHGGVGSQLEPAQPFQEAFKAVELKGCA
jgi:hypothetical protein